MNEVRKQIIISIWDKSIQGRGKSNQGFGDKNELCLLRNSKNNKVAEGKLEMGKELEIGPRVKQKTELHKPRLW